ncbi:unnamed protein product [Prunus armeniaca]|uniref:Uncharacterized protein n=1 Tax=Prunus armeniaca TaxID=36596 RepID=A0A6J5V2U5_PRUAR|nr:unnamed protein product [Prunus armeniaca]CAB4283281.1 unnamed protein product [Prunus armeniaca]CAB4313689.1 unnamed protein product [Prunus armeniaca]
MSSKQDVTSALWPSTNDHPGSSSQPPPQNDNGGSSQDVTSALWPSTNNHRGSLSQPPPQNDNGGRSSVQPNAQSVFGR